MFDLTRRKWRQDARQHSRRSEGANSEKRKKNRKKKTQGRKKKLIGILQSGCFGKTLQTTPVGEYPRRAKQKSWELVIRLYLSLWSLFLAVDVSRWRPIDDSHVPEVCVKLPWSQRRRFFPTCSFFSSVFRFSFFILAGSSVNTRVTSRCGLQVRLRYRSVDSPQPVDNI